MKEYFLEELLKIKNGRDHKHLPDGSIPVYGSGGIMRYGNQAIYDDESILLPRKGTLSNIQFVNKPFWSVDTIYYTIVDKEKANPLYLFHYLKQLDLSYLNSGTGVPSMTFGAYYQVKVNLPSLFIQKKIAKVLSDLDAKIEINNKINAELEAMAKMMYDYWFVQFDFPFDFAQGKPDVNGKPYKSSGGKMVWNAELKREIPEGWEVKKIDEVLKTDLGGTPSTKVKEYWGEEFPWLNSGEIANFPIIDSELKVTEAGINNSATTLMPRGTCVLSITRHLRPSILGVDSCANQSVVGLFESELIKASYIYPYLVNEIPRLMSLRTGAQQPHINKGIVDESLIIVPKEEVLNRYYATVDSMYEKINNNAFQNKELTELRDWLLPMLMNGQIKVADAEEMVNNPLDMVAETSVVYQLNLTDKDKKIRRKMLATYIINQSLNDISFGKTKFEKLLHLIEFHIVKGDYNQKYSIQAAGPYDGGFTKVFWNEVTKAKWFKFEDFGKLKRIIPAENHSKSMIEYDYFSDDLKLRINDFIAHFANTNFERPEIASTLYAVWNNRMIRNEMITDELLKKDFLEWDAQKVKYKDRLDKALEWMRENAIIPDGWGKEIRRAKK